MNYILEFEIDGIPPTQNGSRGNLHAHASEMRKWRKSVSMVAFYRRPSEPLKKAKLTVTRCSSVRSDFGNRVGAAKPILDGLIDAKVILDDNDDVLPPDLQSYPYEKAKPGKSKTRIRIEEIAA